MSRRTVLLKKHLYTGTAVGADTTTDACDVTQFDNVGIQINWANGTSTPAGPITILASIDGVNYGILSSVPTSAISGASGSILIDLNQISFGGIKVRWARTTGAADLDVYVQGRALTA
jgi:hypothetical protein